MQSREYVSLTIPLWPSLSEPVKQRWSLYRLLLLLSMCVYLEPSNASPSMLEMVPKTLFMLGKLNTHLLALNILEHFVMGAHCIAQAD